MRALCFTLCMNFFCMDFFLNENELCDPEVGAVGGESWTPKGNQTPGGYLCPEPVLGRGGGLGAHSPSRKDHLSHVT